jgi:hypothetical protein
MTKEQSGPTTVAEPDWAPSVGPTPLATPVSATARLFGDRMALLLARCDDVREVWLRLP